jgi:hypothetical protein
MEVNLDSGTFFNSNSLICIKTGLEYFLMDLAIYFLATRDRPVISSGWGRPMISKIVGATSANAPGSPETSMFPFSPVTMNGTGSAC